MRGSPNRKPSNGTIILLMLLVIGVVFEHVVNTPLTGILVESLLLALAIGTVILALRYMVVSSA